MMQFLAVGVGGFLGAIARYGLSLLVHRRYGDGFPAGTLTVNVIGCLLIGVLWTLVEEHELIGSNTRLVLGVGFLGSLTTFSTFGHETIELVRAGDSRLALVSVGANLVLGLVAVLAGRGLVRLIEWF